MSTRSGRKGRLRGFTIIEILVAMSIFVLFVSSVYGAFRQANKSTVGTEERAEVYQTARVLIEKINRELRSAYQPRTATTSSLVGEDTEGDPTAPQFDKLTFITTAHSMTTGEEPAGDVCQVQYLIGQDADENPLGLYMVENPHPGLEPDNEVRDPQEVSDLVVGMNCKYLDPDTDEWVDDWTDRPQLPKAVRVELALQAKRKGAKPVLVATTANLPPPPPAGAASTTGGTGASSMGTGSESTSTGGGSFPSGSSQGGTGAPTGGGRRAR
ncbi:MAG TPA: prepilin-type N-terminal cleavage/methylation domain-containing protein [Armatimonadota bacterium]|jgi:type II secretion system protein J